MHIALTGTSGFIGAATVERLHGLGHTVTALVRDTSRRDHIEPFVDRFVVGTHDDQSVWPALLDGADCVIHNSVDWKPLERPIQLETHLASNLVASIKLLHASAPRQFVFVSTIGVHHDMRPRWNGHIDEDHPLRPATPYGAYKAAVEAHLWAAHFGAGQHTCALRPCGVYGIDPRLDRSHGYSLVKKLRNGQGVTKQGGGKFVHVEDVAAAICATVGNPDAAGRAFDLVDCYARWADWADLAAQLLDVKVEIDRSSPERPKNEFSKDAAHSLGISIDRGHEGIRDHLAELIEVMRHQPS